MRLRKGCGAIIVAAFALGGLVVSSPTHAQVDGDPGDLVSIDAADGPTSTFSGAKSVTGKLAQTDPELVGRTDASQVAVVVKLDYDAAASYAGGIAGLPATSPSVTGTDLTGESPAEQAYARYTGEIDSQFRDEVAAQVPDAWVGESLTTVYGGVVMRLPANQIDSVLQLPDVAAVQADELRQPETDSSTSFIGVPTIWKQEGGQALAGKGVVFADLDSGVWPEHPSFADNPALGDPPPTRSGQPRHCAFGDNPLTPAADVFQCNHKLIGGQPFLQTYNLLVGGEMFPDTARDSEGHGTHTTSTAAGNIVQGATIFGIDRGTISGVAPGAFVMEYKVCGAQGCFSSDSAAAVQQAIRDGADVINFSISGGSSPFTDPVELAFRDAYQAGVTVAASAGNSGPGAGTTDHRSPWVITVAASTQTRAFQSTLTMTDGSATQTFVGSSLTTGVSTPAPVVLASTIVAADPQSMCGNALPPGSATGTIVACARGGGIGRIQKGVNVLAGGAVGMILYNPTLQDTETDNHFLPAIHLADGRQFLAFLASHPGATATFTDGVKGTGKGDVMASFSSRGPGGLFLKPDITAPGVQILAGNTPIHDEGDVASGPDGEYYQAIAGTSMSAPHIAGSALLVKALHHDWTPGKIKSALMTTATTAVLKDNETTPADPFDFGAGRVDLNVAGTAPIVFDATADDMTALGDNPVTAMNVNVPSINVPTMPGTVTLTRTAQNVTNKAYNYVVNVTSPDGSKIKVVPSSGKIKAGQTQKFEITIKSSAPSAQYFGQINFNSTTGVPSVHLPVAFFNQQGDVTMAQKCTPTTIAEGATTTCTVTVENTSSADTAVVAQSTVTDELKITDATGAQTDRRGTTVSVGPVILQGTTPSIPSITPVNRPFLDLEAAGIAPVDQSDDEITNFPIPSFVYGKKTFTSIGVGSNGYVVAGGGTSADISARPQQLPNPARPNNVLAPYWTDLDGSDGLRVALATFSSGANYEIVQWNTFIFGTTQARSFQVWIGLNGVQDLAYAYADATLGTGAPADLGLTVGAENSDGTAGAQIAGPPVHSYGIASTDPLLGESLVYTFTAKGKSVGNATVKSTMKSDLVGGTTIEKTKIKVR